MIFLFLIPLYSHIGESIITWDGIVSWNNWAIQLTEEYYIPYNGPYPILYPALWSLVYIIQDSSSLWITAKTTLLIIPTFLIILLFQLPKKNFVFSFIILCFLYPIYNFGTITLALMDIPVMLVGLISLISLHLANTDENNFDFYLYVALFLAGISSIIKLQGLMFVIFVLLYSLVIGLQKIKNKKILILIIGLTISYFLSFFILYYINQSDLLGISSHLSRLSSTYHNIDFIDIYYKFVAEPLVNTPVYSYLIFFGVFLNIFNLSIRKNFIGLISIIFIIVGVVLWYKYAFYDNRNALYIRSFVIISSAIGYSWLFQKFIDKVNIPKWTNSYSIPYHLFHIIIIVTLLVLLYFVQDKYLEKLQYKQSLKFGNVNSAKQLSNLLKNKPKCVKLFTDDIAIKFNPLIEKNRIVGYDGYGIETFNKMKIHECDEGSYFSMVSPLSKQYQPTKRYLQNMIKNNRLIFIGNIKKENYLYYLKPLNEKK
jgi:hypothetical protein